jgi:transketolase
MRIGERAGLRPADQLRKAAGEAMLAVARANPKVVVLDGDLGNSTGAHDVKKEFPERFFNVGIAEANMVCIAAGLAANGYIPIVTSLASFLFNNAFDQLRLSVAIPALNVKCVGSHAGISTGREGPSSMSTEDFALAGALAPFVVLVPCDPASMHKAMHAAVAHVGPVYVRSTREPLPHVYTSDHCPFEIGKANLLRMGRDVTIIANGLMVPVALDAAVILAEEGIQARVLDMHTVKPLDRAAIEAAARETGAIVTAEEQMLTGGMGANIARIVAETCPVPMRFVAIRDEYTGSGSPAELMARHGLTAEDVVGATKEVMVVKNGGRLVNWSVVDW